MMPLNYPFALQIRDSAADMQNSVVGAGTHSEMLRHIVQ